MKDKFNINGIDYTVIATYHDDEKNKDYVMYTDETHNEKNQLNVYYGCYKENESITPIDNNDDINVIKEMLDEIIRSSKETN